MRTANTNTLLSKIATTVILSLGLGNFSTAFAQLIPEVTPGEAAAPVLSTKPGIERPQKHPTYKELMAPKNKKAVDWDKIKLTDSKGKEFTAEKFRGKILLVNFFFSHCPDVCPPQTAGLLKVLNSLDKEVEDSVMFVSITIDPDNDTTKALEAYKKQFSIKSDAWTFARTSKDKLAKVGEYFGSLNGDPKKPLDHKARLYLVNTDGSYLLSYDSTVIDVPRLTKDLTDAAHTFVKKPWKNKQTKVDAPAATTLAEAAPIAPAPANASPTPEAKK